VNVLRNLDETYREYSLAATNDLIRFWKSKVKVTAGHRGGKVIQVDAGASKTIFYFFIKHRLNELVPFIAARVYFISIFGIDNYKNVLCLLNSARNFSVL